MNKQSVGFTIVELLVVIVVIGILAAITIISYTGISKKADTSTLQSDLSNSSNLLKMYQVDNGSYPYDLNGSNCPVSSGSVVDNRYCLKVSPDVDVKYDSISPSSYTLTATKNGITYSINEGGAITYIAPGKYFLRISSGRMYTCGIASDNNVYCWGYGAQGQLGNNSTSDKLVPTALDTTGALSGKTIKSISAGHLHTCAIASDNNAYCWGSDVGAIGDGMSLSQRQVPVAVSTAGALNGKTVKSITTGDSHTCAIASDDNAYCWGSGGNAQLGNNSTDQKTVPTAVYTAGALSGKTIKSISAGDYHTCAIASDDLAYCWGSNSYGQLGDGTTTQRATPTPVNTGGVLSGKTIKSISANYSDHTCVIASDNQAYCWGDNYAGRLGDNSNTNSSIPVPVYNSGALNGKTISQIFVDFGHTCVIASNNQAYCWGYGGYGALGNNSTADSFVPVAVDTTGVLNGKTIQYISMSLYGGCVIASNNQVYCWGVNSQGSLGNDSTVDSLVPVSVNAIP